MGDSKADMDKTFTPTANLMWPVLTRSNYQSWASHIQCNLEGLNLWDAIEKGEKAERRQDRLALGSMLRGVPTEMHSMLLNKKTAKEAWEAIKTMLLGADRVKEVNAQKLLGEFEAMAFKPGESIDDFALRITKLVTDLHGLGEESVTDTRMVKKFLCVVPSKYYQVAVAVEMVKDLKTLTIEDLVAHLRAAEERLEPSVDQVAEKAGKLLLTEEEWAARNKSQMILIHPDQVTRVVVVEAISPMTRSTGSVPTKVEMVRRGTLDPHLRTHQRGRASAGSVGLMDTGAGSAQGVKHKGISRK